ncbi:uncharacterized protein DS421_5g146960 [Arachis hypogaea]|nr:uncharacterized protein DS421_5g146960 [Arachis hypogaea]
MNSSSATTYQSLSLSVISQNKLNKNGKSSRLSSHSHAAFLSLHARARFLMDMSLSPFLVVFVSFFSLSHGFRLHIRRRSAAFTATIRRFIWIDPLSTIAFFGGKD